MSDALVSTKNGMEKPGSAKTGAQTIAFLRESKAP